MEKEDSDPKEKKIDDISEIKEEKIKPSGNEEIKKLDDGQIKSNNKILKKVFVGLGIFVVLFIFIILFINSINSFEYKGINFNVVKDTGDLIFYNTAFPMYSSETGEHVADYNVYLRTDPRKLQNIVFEGDINLAKILVINSTGFNCEGNGVIAIANFVQVFGAIGTQVVKDQNASCDSQGRYMFVQIQSGNETSIKQVGPSCYEFNVNNCEILEVTERFIVETLAQINEVKKT